MNDKKDYQEYIKELGQKIKTYRIMKEMSQQDLEDKTGVSKRSISRLEQGESVQVDNLFKILLALELGDNIELLVPDQTKRPSFYLEKPADKPKRVRKKIKKANLNGGMNSEYYSRSVFVGDTNRNYSSGEYHYKNRKYRRIGGKIEYV